MKILIKKICQPIAERHNRCSQTVVQLCVASILGLTFLGCSSSMVWAEAGPPSKINNTRELLELTRTIDVAKQSLAMTLSRLKEEQPSVPEERWTRLERHVHMEELIELVIPVMETHLSSHDIAALIEFYQSPVGQTLLRVAPAMMRDLQLATQQWTQQYIQELLEEIKKKEPRKGSKREEHG